MQTGIERNSVFGWIALATGVVLIIPLVAMQFTDEVDWDRVDFITMGVLLFGIGSLFVLVARRVARKYWPVIGLLFASALFFIWAELAVGIFTNFGS